MRYLLLAFLPLAILEPVKAAPVSGQQCVKNSFDKTWSDLRHEVAVMKDDQRYGIEEGGPHYGLAPSESDYLKQVTGEVRCESPKKGTRLIGSGVMVGQRNQIATNAHLILQALNETPQGRCFFTNHASPPQRRRILLESKPKVGTRDPSGDFGNDWAIMELDRSIDGVSPMPIASPATIKEKDKVFMVSASMTRMRRAFSPGEPIIQQCTVNDILGADNVSGTLMYSDCSSTVGASGSLVFTRDAGGQLVALGINKGSGTAEMDNQPYSWEKQNYAMAIAFDGKFGETLRELRQR